MAVLTIVVPILIFALVGFIIFIYRIIYKQNMNRALEGRATTGLIEIGPLLKTLTFIGLIIMNIVALTKIEDLTWQIRNVESNLNNQINFLRSEINGLSNEMNEYYQSLELVQSKSSVIKQVDLTNNKYTFEIKFTLSELEDPTSDVYLVQEHNGSTTKTLITSDTLTFIENVTLDYSTTVYNFSVMLEGSKIIQEEIITIDVSRYEDSIVRVYSGFGENDEDFLIYSFVYEDIPLVDGVDVESVIVKVIEGDTVLKTETITNTTSLSTLMAAYPEYTFWEYKYEQQTSPLFGLVYEATDFADVYFEYTITLSDGTVIERINEGF